MTKEQRLFWDRVEMAIGRSGKTKCQIAREAGIHRGTLGVRPQKEQIMSVNTIRSFCKVTGASADWLLGLKEEY